MPAHAPSHPDSRHFPVLDGLRGIAAAIVVMLHTQRHWGIELPHAFLAVDLFFVLSGFVLTHAYLQPLRSGALPLRTFMVLRVARLYPAFLLGLLLAAVTIVGPLLLHHARSLAVMADYVGAVLFGLLMLPFPIRADGSALFPLNPPMWSLAIELGSNLLLAALAAALARGGARPLAVAPRLAVVSALALLLVVCGSRLGTLDIGSRWVALGIVGGFARACYGMLVGSLLHGMRARLQHAPFGQAGLVVAFALAALMLLSPTLADARHDLLLELCGVLVAMPLAVALALGARSTALDAPMLWLGRISYPLYVMHFPILHVCEVLRLDQRLHFAAAPGVVTVLLSVATAWWMSSRYEAPLRDRLRRWLNGGSTR